MTTWCSDWHSQLNDVAVQKVMSLSQNIVFDFHAVWINGFQTVCLGFYIISTLYSWLHRSEKHAVDTPKNIHSGDSLALSGATEYRWWHATLNLQWAVGKNSTYFEGGQHYCSSLQKWLRWAGWCWQHECGVIWDYIALKIYCLRENCHFLRPIQTKFPFLKAWLADPNKFEFICGLMGHPNKIWLFMCMPAVIWTY